MGEISVCVSPIMGTTTPEKGCAWIAVADVDNRRLATKDRSNPVRALCRELVRLGIPDARMVVYDQYGRLALTYRSFYSAAKLTLQENAKRPIGLAKFQESPWAAETKLAAE